MVIGIIANQQHRLNLWVRSQREAPIPRYEHAALALTSSQKFGVGLALRRKRCVVTRGAKPARDPAEVLVAEQAQYRAHVRGRVIIDDVCAWRLWVSNAVIRRLSAPAAIVDVHPSASMRLATCTAATARSASSSAVKLISPSLGRRSWRLERA